MTVPGSSSGEFETVHCPACGPFDSVIWQSSVGPARYLRCSGCGTVYASPRSTAQVRHAWIDTCFGVGENAIKNAESRLPVIRREAERIQSLAPQGRVLDVGCDLGDFLALFPLDCWERFGVELSPSAAAYAELHSKATVFAGVLGDAKFPENKFQLATLIDVIFYLDDPVSDLKEIFRVLDKEGLFVIETTGQFYQLTRSKGVVSWLVDGRWTRMKPNGAYIFWFSLKGLETILEQAGFRVTGYEVMPGSPQNNWFLRLITNAYLNMVKTLVALFPSALALAPKYLLYASPRGCRPEPVVRRAGLKDIADIVMLHSRNIRPDDPTLRDRRILSHYYSELLRRPDCSLHVAECNGKILGYSAVISGHRKLLGTVGLFHPIECSLYLAESLLSVKAWKIVFKRIYRELFLKKWPGGMPPIGPHCELRSIAVDPEHRAGGLAFRLLDASVKQLQRNGHRKCIAWVASTNMASLRLFEKAGFSTLMVRKNNGPEVHILQLEIHKDID